MIELSKFIKNANGRIILSILFGFGLASLCREICREKKCMINMVPSFNEMKNNIYKSNGKCFTISEPTAVKCDSSKKIISVDNTL